MLKKTIIVIAIVFLTGSPVHSQNNNLRTPFLSIHTGVFLSSINDFDKTYDSKIGFVYGFGGALPLSSRSYLYGKATIFKKTGTGLITHYGFINGAWVLYETKDGTAKYTQWIINVGYLYNIFLSPDITLGINGGLTYMNISEQQNDITGSITSTPKGTAAVGIFGGIDIEKNFAESPISLFFDTQYNLSKGNIIFMLGNYNGLNMNIGAKYYFKERRVE